MKKENNSPFKQIFEALPKEVMLNFLQTMNGKMKEKDNEIKQLKKKLKLDDTTK